MNNRSFRITALAAAMTVLSYPGTALGEQNELELAPVVVTPTLSAETVRETLSSVTVIDREQIDRQQPREFSELLEGRAGVDITSNGGFGKTTSVFTRGAGSESTILLIDGIRIRSATSGGAPWQFIPPQLVDRVEVVRGPRGSLYGADAVGGVVQAFTPDGSDRSSWVQTGGGSFGTYEAGAGASGGDSRSRFSVAANHFSTDGEPVRQGDEDKGFDNTSGILQAAYRLDNGIELSVLGLEAQGNTEFDGGETDFRIQTLGTRAEAAVTEHWITRLQFSQSRDEADNDSDSFGESTFDTRNRTVRWENALTRGSHELVLGGEFLRDEVDSTTDFEEDSRKNTAVFGQGMLGLGDFDVQASLRWDDNEAFGEHVTGGLALGYALNYNHRLRASYGTAFRAPTFNDLYFPGFGNPDLDPEESETVEFGVQGHYETFFWDLAAYRTEADDLIQTTFVGGSFAPENVTEATIRGVELSAGATPGQWKINASASYTDPRDEETDNLLRRRARESARLEIDRQVGDWSFGATGIAQGERFDDADNEDRLSGFGRLNLRASWAFARHWSARLTVDNALDKDYATAFLDASEGIVYNQPGRGVFLTLRYGGR